MSNYMHCHLNMSADITFTSLVMDLSDPMYPESRLCMCISVYMYTYAYFLHMCIHTYLCVHVYIHRNLSLRSDLTQLVKLVKVG